VLLIIIIIYVIITKIKKKIKILSSLQSKILCYLLCIIGGVYHPGFPVVFICFGTIHIYSCCYYYYYYSVLCVSSYLLEYDVVIVFISLECVVYFLSSGRLYIVPVPGFILKFLF
jgi:hypothetical protein